MSVGIIRKYQKSDPHAGRCVPRQNPSENTQFGKCEQDRNDLCDHERIHENPSY